MLGYTVKRILQVIPVLLIISFICFMMIRLVPGDPVANMLGINASKEAIAAQRAELGLDKPLLTQYGDFLVKALHGDLGKSITTRRPVIDEIAQRYPATLKLALGATVFAAVVGITFGVLSAVKQNKLTDNVIMVFSLLSVSTPSFFLALVMLLLFSIHLGWLPSMGLRTPLHYVLPIITLGMQSVGLIARTTRSSMLEVLRQDYIRTSRSRGISQAVIVMRHAFKNALIPVVTVVGLRFGGLLAGSMLVEAVFSVPGIGRFMVDGVLKRDYPVVQGTVLVLATTFVLVNLAVDLIYALIDPRIKYD
ncbi:nickel ABC transporter permease [Anaerotruncus colihominis]|uniref:Nickel import system permease protein NikB n=2 Tax=Bacillati TaxID=1783272 RepID=A0A845SPI5_9FIRM|nr:nickel ABC transporter permease [Anaerotruncus colihominis]MCR2026126.1 ABC transporter permease [Anaerotruncus colihominis]NBI78617.1 ABC transporter permease [Anaerotruncus colihominis]NDO38396.1 ABC transporter permease [Anaerotruncus colihominis]